MADGAISQATPIADRAGPLPPLRRPAPAVALDPQADRRLRQPAAAGALSLLGLGLSLVVALETRAGRGRTQRVESGGMDGWVWWVVAAGALAVGEILTLGFFLGPLAIAALLAAAVGLAGAGLAAQLAVFIAAAAASLAFLRPVARRHMRTPARLRSGAAALVGSRALVLERVTADGGKVKIGGEVWSARTFDEDDVLEAGARAQVIQIDGATALVSD